MAGCARGPIWRERAAPRVLPTRRGARVDPTRACRMRARSLEDSMRNRSRSTFSRRALVQAIGVALCFAAAGVAQTTLRQRTMEQAHAPAMAFDANRNRV